MKVKHKLLSDYQYITSDKKIFIIKTNTILEDYCFKAKGENIYIDRDIIDANPEIFQIIDWKMELLVWLKANKIPQPSVMSKKLIPFIDEMVISAMTPINNSSISTDINLLQEVNDKEIKIINLKKELDYKESDLTLREKRIKDVEDEISIRLNMIEKREDDYKLNLEQLSIKDDEIRDKLKELSAKEIELNIKNNEINEKEREVSNNILLSTQDIDNKYKELQDKINKDMLTLKNKEHEIEVRFTELKDLETKIENTKDSNINIKYELYQELKYELMGVESDITNLYKISNALKNFNHPIILDAATELISCIDKLKKRIDNNKFR